jgi:hypothetical protein
LDINEKQNSEWNLKRLASQRQLYSDAKKVLLVQFILCGIFTLGLAIVGNIISERFAIYIVLSAILIVFLDEFILSRTIDRTIEEAARIQEEFDCDVLQLPQNNIKFNNASMRETIQQKSNEYISIHKNYHALISRLNQQKI